MDIQRTMPGKAFAFLLCASLCLSGPAQPALCQLLSAQAVPAPAAPGAFQAGAGPAPGLLGTSVSSLSGPSLSQGLGLPMPALPSVTGIAPSVEVQAPAASAASAAAARSARLGARALAAPAAVRLPSESRTAPAAAGLTPVRGIPRTHVVSPLLRPAVRAARAAVRGMQAMVHAFARRDLGAVQGPSAAAFDGAAPSATAVPAAWDGATDVTGSSELPAYYDEARRLADVVREAMAEFAAQGLLVPDRLDVQVTLGHGWAGTGYVPGFDGRPGTILISADLVNGLKLTDEPIVLREAVRAMLSLEWKAPTAETDLYYRAATDFLGDFLVDLKGYEEPSQDPELSFRASPGLMSKDDLQRPAVAESFNTQRGFFKPVSPSDYVRDDERSPRRLLVPLRRMFYQRVVSDSLPEERMLLFARAADFLRESNHPEVAYPKGTLSPYLINHFMMAELDRWLESGRFGSGKPESARLSAYKAEPRVERWSPPPEPEVPEYRQERQAPPPDERWGLIGAIAGGILNHGASAEAVTRAETLLRRMLEDADIEVLRRLAPKRPEIHIFPAWMKLTDVPGFEGLRGQKTFDGRPWESVRGVTQGYDGRMAVGEENLLHSQITLPRGYSFVHEMGHLVRFLTLGTLPLEGTLGLPAFSDILEIYRKAMDASGTTGLGSYADSNVEEMWAEATAAFFGVGPNGRTSYDVELAQPELFAALKRVFGPPKGLTDERGQSRPEARIDPQQALELIRALSKALEVLDQRKTGR